MSTQTPPPSNDSKPVLVLGSIAAAATALITLLATISGLPVWVVPALGAVATVCTAVGAFITQRKTAPWANVDRIYVDQTGQTVAGPASPLATGTVISDTGGEL